MAILARIRAIWRHLPRGAHLLFFDVKPVTVKAYGGSRYTSEERLVLGRPQKTRGRFYLFLVYDLASNLEWEATFEGRPELRDQLARMADRNVTDGRDVSVVSCWFLGDKESRRMWNEYVGSVEGVALRSTLERLERSILAKREFTNIGKVKYVDCSGHDMGIYHGHQAGERALLKQTEYSFENEVRIVTMNLVCSGCLNVDGSPPTETQLAGPGMFDPSRPGLYLRVGPNTLVEAVVTAPGAEQWFHDLVGRLCKRYQIKSLVERSRLNPA